MEYLVWYNILKMQNDSLGYDVTGILIVFSYNLELGSIAEKENYLIIGKLADSLL